MSEDHSCSSEVCYIMACVCEHMSCPTSSHSSQGQDEVWVPAGDISDRDPGSAGSAWTPPRPAHMLREPHVAVQTAKSRRAASKNNA